MESRVDNGSGELYLFFSFFCTFISIRFHFFTSYFSAKMCGFRDFISIDIQSIFWYRSKLNKYLCRQSRRFNTNKQNIFRRKKIATDITRFGFFFSYFMCVSQFIRNSVEFSINIKWPWDLFAISCAKNKNIHSIRYSQRSEWEL